MKVLLVEHPKKLWPLFGNSVAQPTHLACLAAVLEENDIAVDILDCNVLDYEWNEYEDFLKKTSPDIVGVSGLTTYLPLVIKTLRVTKKVNPKIITVVGGTHFTLTPKSSLANYPEIDYVVIGEGEITFLELVESLESGNKVSNVKGIAYRDGEEIILSPERPLIEDLDTLPMPAYHKLPMDKYHFILWNKRLCNTTSSRGCTFSCTFCTERILWRNCYRARSARKTVDEIELLKNKYGTQIVWFGDDCFNLDRKRTEQIVDELEQRKLGVKVWIESRADTILRDADLIPRWSKAGLFYVLLGLESSSNSDLKYLNKKSTIEIAKRAVALLKQNNIIAHTNFVVGLPSDTKQSIRRTMVFARSIKPDVAVFTPLTPFQGTEIHDEISSLGLIKEKNLANWDFLTPVAETLNLSRRQIQIEILKAYGGFYLDPRLIIETLFSKKPYHREVVLAAIRSMPLFALKRVISNIYAKDS